MIPVAIQNQINNQKQNLPWSKLAQTSLFCYFTSLEDGLVFSQENLDELLDKGTISVLYTIPLLPDLDSGYAERQTEDAIFNGTLMSANSSTEQDGQILVENPLLRFVNTEKLVFASHINIPNDKALRFFRLEKPPTTKLDETGNIVNLTPKEIDTYERNYQKTYYLFAKKTVFKPPTTNKEREVAYYIYTFNEFSKQIKKNWFVMLSSRKITKTIGGLPDEEITQQILNENKGVVKVRLKTTQPMLLNNFELRGSRDRKSTSNFQQLDADTLHINSIRVPNDQEKTRTSWRVIKLNPTLINGGSDVQWQCQQATEYNNFYKNVVNEDYGITNLDKAPTGFYPIFGENKNSTLDNGKSIFNAFETDNGVDEEYNSKTAIISTISKLFHHSFDKTYQGGKWGNGLGLLEKAYKTAGDLSSLRLLNSIFNFDFLTNATNLEVENPEEYHCTPVASWLEAGTNIKPKARIIYDSLTGEIEKNELYCEFNILEPGERTYGRLLDNGNPDLSAVGAPYIHTNMYTKKLYDKNKPMFSFNWIAFYKLKQSAEFVIGLWKFREQIALMMSGLIFNEYFASNEILLDFINGDFQYNSQSFQNFPRTFETKGIINTVGSNIIDRFSTIDTVEKPSSYYCLMEVEEQDLPWISHTEGSFGDRPSISLLNPKPMELVAFSKTYQTLSSPTATIDNYSFGDINNIFTQEQLDGGLSVQLETRVGGLIRTISSPGYYTSLEQTIVFPVLDSDGDPKKTDNWYRYRYTDISGDTTNEYRTVRLEALIINGRRLELGGSETGFQYTTKTWGTSSSFHSETKYYKEWQVELESLITHSVVHSHQDLSFSEVSQLIYNGLWGMNQHLSLDTPTYGAETKIGILQEDYFARNKPQEIELELPSHSTDYGTLTSDNDGYAISELTLGIFCRGDITVEYLDVDNNIVKTQKVAGQKAGTQNAKILSHTIIG